jgi:hypothetical protein
MAKSSIAIYWILIARKIQPKKWKGTANLHMKSTMSRNTK